MVIEKVNKEKEKVEHHLGLRRLEPPAFPHMKPPGVSQKKEMGKEECVGGGLAGSQQEHWLLLKQDGRQMMVQPGGKPGSWLPAVCAEPLQLHHDDGGVSQELGARWSELYQLRVRMVKTQAEA